MQTNATNPTGMSASALSNADDVASVLAKWSAASAKAREAIFDAMQLQHDVEKLIPTKLPKHLARDVAKRIAAIRKLNLNGMLLDLAETEDDGAEFIEDGSLPTTEPGFISAEEDAAPLSDYEKNRRSLHSAIKGTVAAFREE